MNVVCIVGIETRRYEYHHHRVSTILWVEYKRLSSWRKRTKRGEINKFHTHKHTYIHHIDRHIIYI